MKIMSDTRQLEVKVIELEDRVRQLEQIIKQLQGDK